MHEILKLTGALGSLAGLVIFRGFERPILGLGIFTLALFVFPVAMMFPPSRVPTATAPGGFRRAYITNRIILWIGIVSFALPICVAFSGWPYGRFAGTFVIFGIFVFVLAIFLVRTNLRCPNCNRQFYGDESDNSHVGWNVFVRKCKHCGHRAGTADV
jgi:hypothetical protein